MAARHDALRLFLRKGCIMIKFSYKKTLEEWHNLNNPNNNQTRNDGKRDTHKGPLPDLVRYTSFIKKYVYTTLVAQGGKTIQYRILKAEYEGSKTIFQGKVYTYDRLDFSECFYKQKSDMANKDYNIFIADYIKNIVNDII